MKIVKVSQNSKEVDRICARGVAPTEEIYAKVRKIMDDVRKGGLSKAVEYAKKFDGLKGDDLRIDEKTLRERAKRVDPFLVKALRHAIRNATRFHRHELHSIGSFAFRGKDGEILGQRVRPMRRVGLYVPGGAAVYPSTVIMNAVPALVAGVEQIVVTTPAKDGIDPSVAFVLLELGIKEVYHIGGAQAIAFLAYGSKEVEPVDKIVGPGNVYAAIAKREVFGKVDIDMIAGPSEILVLADSAANPEYVAADLLSQAEHGSGFEASICITDSMEMAKRISKAVDARVEISPKRELLEKVLENFGRILVVENWDDGVAVANRIAPEHLEVMTENADELSHEILNAGAIFIGPWSSEPVGDYFAGPDHVLPTNGTARFSSPLGVYDFVKRTSVINYTEKAILKQAKMIAEIAETEGFYHHAQAVLARLDE